jgi:hypothetical protein
MPLDGRDLHTLSGGLLGGLRGLLAGLGCELGYVLLVLLELLLELLGIDGRRGILGRFVCGDGRHIRATEVVERAKRRSAPCPHGQSPARPGSRDRGSVMGRASK